MLTQVSLAVRKCVIVTQCVCYECVSVWRSKHVVTVLVVTLDLLLVALSRNSSFVQDTSHDAARDVPHGVNESSTNGGKHVLPFLCRVVFA